MDIAFELVMKRQSIWVAAKSVPETERDLLAAK